MADLVKRGIAIDERPQGGAVIVKIDELLGPTKEQYRTLVVLRSDGTACMPPKTWLSPCTNSAITRRGPLDLRGGCAPVAAFHAGLQDPRNRRL